MDHRQLVFLQAEEPVAVLVQMLHLGLEDITVNGESETMVLAVGCLYTWVE
jgi:hypothetical protein